MSNAVSSSVALTPEQQDLQVLFELQELTTLSLKGGQTTDLLQLSSLPLVSRPDHIHALSYSHHAKP